MNLTGRVLIDSDFVVYRPPRSSGRLEKKFVSNSNNNNNSNSVVNDSPTITNGKDWRPSISYKYSLQEIANQITPAEQYRHQLATSGKEIRSLQRLELRWNRNLELFTSFAIKVQKVFRGVKGRERFLVVKDVLYMKYRQREALRIASDYFRQEEYTSAITTANELSPVTIDVLIVKMKSLYQINKYKECISTGHEVLGKLYYSQGGTTISLVTIPLPTVPVLNS